MGCSIAPRRRSASRTALARRVQEIARSASADDRGADRDSLRMALSTVSAVLKRVGLGKRSGLDPPEPPNRYERRQRRRADPYRRQEARQYPWSRASRHRAPQASQKRRRNGRRRLAGWEFVHVCVDDPSRLAYAEVLEDERATTAVGSSARRRVLRRSRHHVERVMTDNGACYLSTSTPRLPDELGSAIYARALTAHAPTARRSDSSRPSSASGPTARSTAAQPNAPQHSAGWLTHYNITRPHGSLSHKPPIARLAELKNLPGPYT